MFLMPCCCGFFITFCTLIIIEILKEARFDHFNGDYMVNGEREDICCFFYHSVFGIDKYSVLYFVGNL